MTRKFRPKPSGDPRRDALTLARFRQANPPDVLAEKVLLNVMQARTAFSETVNRAAFGNERIVLERHGKPVAALVSVDDLLLLEELENCADVEAARKALRERGSVSLEDLKADLDF